MAFPVIAASATDTNASSTFEMNLPTGISAGDLLMLFVRCSNSSSIPAPSGWSTLYNASSVDDDDIACFYKKAVGDEGSTVSISLDSDATSISIRVTGAEDPTVTAPAASSQTQAVSDSPDGASFSPAGGAKDYLWIYHLSMDAGGSTTFTSGDPPTTTESDSFGGKIGPVTTGGGTGNCTQWLWSLQKNDSNLDPVAQLLNGTRRWDVWTVAIHPSAAGGVWVPKVSLL